VVKRAISGRRAALGAFLSFVWPGGGQALHGWRRYAAIQATPIALAAVLVIAAVLIVGTIGVVLYLFSPAVSLGLIAVVAFLGIWRILSIVDAARPGYRAARVRIGTWTGALVLVVFVSHTWVGWTLYSFYRAGQVISQPIVAGVTDVPGQSPGTDGTPNADGTVTPGQTGRPGQQATPEPAILPGVNSRVTILLVGVDNTHTRDYGLTDTLIVASFDPQSQSLDMISIPRDTTRLPFYSGGEWQPRINALYASAGRNPDSFPDGPMGTLVNEVSYIVGIPIDYYAQIDIAGFSQLIDAVGGVDVTLDTTLDDPGYQFSPTEIGFHLDPGTYHLNGKYATAFARSRHGSSDYDRAARQQKILLALRAKLNDPRVLLNLPNIVDSASQVIRTNAPLDRLPDIVAIAQHSQSADTNRYVLGPPTYAHGVINPLGDRTFQLQLDMNEVANLSVQLFGDLSRYVHPEVRTP